MRIVKQAFDFYINSSIHVAIAVLYLVLMTNHMFHISLDLPIAGFVFFGTVFGYNFVKYESVFRNKKKLRKQLKGITLLSLLAFLVTVFCFFKLELITQIGALIFLGLTLLYTVPFFPNKLNMRNWSGAKIYMVALCWAGITILLPLLNACIEISADVFLKFGQRFLLILILILIFEIIDLKNDDPSLMTVPQQIGVKKTKILGMFLLFPFYFLEFLKSQVDKEQLIINLVLVLIILLFLLFANERRSKYYTSFWVESVPVFWWALVLGFS